MENIIECKNLTHYYGERCIYENLSFNVTPGSIVGLLGKNGTGKTTTINILNGFLKPKSGSCKILGEESNNIPPETRSKIGLLIEGHVQYNYMNISELEKFYSGFFPNWDSKPLHELLAKLQVNREQKISTMSCGQRSQVALGLIMSQDPEVLILDDFSMGLDPGYRRLFVEYLKDYATSRNKTVFVTSHIIQDMEKLIDSCIIMDYGRIITHRPLNDFLTKYKKHQVKAPENKDAISALKNTEGIDHLDVFKDKMEYHSFLSQEEIGMLYQKYNIKADAEKTETVSLEDAFIGITGKY
jgi:ABC-2 type transport system ATP-binding protein